MKYLRQYIRRVIAESTSSYGHLAAYAYMTNAGERTAIIYDYNALMLDNDIIKKLMDAARFRSVTNPATQEFTTYLAKKIVKGMISVGPPIGGNCNGAWQVLNSAGPGLGKIVYLAGYALSPTGKLIPDRGSVTNSAKAAWDKQAARGRPRKRLDDKHHQHDKRGNEYHTEDRDDDCGVYLNSELDQPNNLNYSYDSTPEERAIFDSLLEQHEATMSTKFWSPENRQELEVALGNAGFKFFSLHYNNNY